MARLIAAAAAALVLVGTTPASAADPELLFRITDPRIDEASGIAVGRTSPGVVYVQNDSGDTNRFFALNRETGKTAAVVTVPGAENVDWEDLAVAPDDNGRSAVYLSDTGANHRRDEVRVYRVDEPRIDPEGRDVAVQASGLAVWRLKYPDGAQFNAESLAVTPDGTAFLITKAYTGRSEVFRLPSRPDADEVQTLTRVGSIRFTPTDTPNTFGPPGQLAATGAAISRDGKLLVVRTYADAYVWRLRDGNVAAAVRNRPARTPMPPKQMGEGITFSGGRLLVDSEGIDQAVYSLPIPTLSEPSPSPSTSGSSTPSSPTDGNDGNAPLVVAVVAGGLVVIGAVTALIAARRRRRRAVHGPGSSAG